nr:uncharacterized protein CFP56_10684 [Quercus suber]
MEIQLQWVVNNGPWSFNNQLLLLRRWERGMTANSVNFTHLPIWVQVWGLPFDLFSEEVGNDIGKGLGRVVEVDTKAIASDQARFLRVRVEIPLDKPIRRGSKVQGPEGDTVWIAFKYERLIGLCFNCGRLGHEAKHCVEPKDVDGNGSQYGDWLKGGFRKQYNGENDHYNPPRWPTAMNLGGRSMASAESDQSPAVQGHRSRTGSPRTVGNVTDVGVSNPINVGSEIVTPTLNVHNNCGEFKSHTALTEMGISHPIKHAQINVGESLHHTAPMEVNLINVPLNTGSETATPTLHRRNNCGEIKSHTA